MDQPTNTFVQLFDEKIRKIIDQHVGKDINKFVLTYSGKWDLPINQMIDQIIGRSIAQKKLPDWYGIETVVYPPKLAMEQCSSQMAAEYKSNLFSGESLIDCTGGFGVDSFFFAKNFKNVIYIEKDKYLFDIVNWNAKSIGISNFDLQNDEAIRFLQGNLHLKADIIYVDPARRDRSNKKLVFLKDCQPDVTSHLDLFFQIADKVLVKTSPMLDIDLAVKELMGHVADVHIVSVNNECKEVLYTLDKNEHNDIKIHCVNLLQESRQHFNFVKSEENSANAEYSPLKKYIYEPNSSIYKSGAFNLIAKRFNILKLAKQTHLYTSNEEIWDFPGKIFQVKYTLKYKDPMLSKYLPDRKANIVTRNFPYSPEEIKKSMKIIDGGSIFLFGFCDLDNKPVTALCEKL